MPAFIFGDDMYLVSRSNFIGPSVLGGAVIGEVLGTVGSIIFVPIVCRFWTHIKHGEDDEFLAQIRNNTYEIFPRFLVDIYDERFETHWECTTKMVIFNTISTTLSWAALGAIVGLGRHVYNKCRHGD